jgi:cytochrome c peroxidase
MTLTNDAWNSVQTWANPELLTPEMQALVPMFGEEPVELGLAGMQDALLERLRDEPVYQDLFHEAFPEDADPFTVGNVAKALGCFDRSIVSYRSPFDRFQAGDDGALDASAKRGMELFFGERLECHHCHNGFNFTVSYDDVKAPDGGYVHYFNTGLYNLDGMGAYPASDRGLYDVTGDPATMGRFRPPTLRNVAVTAPYMHDGSVATLDDVLAIYARGGRLITSGPDAGDGAQNPLKNVLLNGFTLSDQDRVDVEAFLGSLTDQALLADPDLADPWR